MEGPQEADTRRGQRTGAGLRKRLTLNGGIILVDEVALDELDGECGLADTWRGLSWER